MTEYKDIVLKVDELWLKGANRSSFVTALKRRVKKVVRAFYDFEFTYDVEGAKHFLSFETSIPEELIDRMKKISGLHSIWFVKKAPLDMNLVCENALQLVSAELENRKSFKVLTRRVHKKFHLTSEAISRQMGTEIQRRYPFLTVDLKKPEFTVWIDVHSNGCYICCRRVLATGGLPIGSAGRMLTMLSGGIDSPVASYLMGKRGVGQSFVFFHAYPFVGDEVLEKIKRLVQTLNPYLDHCPMYIVPFGKIQEELFKRCPQGYRTILFRIYMLKCCEVIAQALGLHGVITGDALGQVSSQTYENLVAVDRCIKEVSIFRPLIGMNKLEIMNIAKSIGTYDISIIPHDDACSLLAPKRPVTCAKFDICENILTQSESDLKKLIFAALGEVQSFTCNQRGRSKMESLSIFDLPSSIS